MKKVNTIIQFVWRIPRNILILLISAYQKTISPDHGLLKGLFPYGYCRFKPTCSSYGKEIIKKRGAFIGSILTFYRIVRCNPWSKGGYDPPK